MRSPWKGGCGWVTEFDTKAIIGKYGCKFCSALLRVCAVRERGEALTLREPNPIDRCRGKGSAILERIDVNWAA